MDENKLWEFANAHPTQGVIAIIVIALAICFIAYIYLRATWGSK